jgi:hypothetical protein
MSISEIGQWPQSEHTVCCVKAMAGAMGDAHRPDSKPRAISYDPGRTRCPERCGRFYSQRFPRASNRYNAQGFTTDVRATDLSDPRRSVFKTSTSIDAEPFQPGQDFGADIAVVAANLCRRQLFLLGEFPDFGSRKAQKLHQLTSCHDNFVIRNTWSCGLLYRHGRLFLIGAAPVANGLARIGESSTWVVSKIVHRSFVTLRRGLSCGYRLMQLSLT